MSYRNNFILFLATCLVFALPSLLLSLIDTSYQIKFSFPMIAFVFFALSLSFAPKIIVYFVLIIFTLIELIQFAHLTYYKFPIPSYSIGLIWQEKNEILEAGLGEFKHIWFFPFLVFIPYGFLIFLYSKFKRKSNIFFVLLVIVFLGFEPYRIIFKERSVNSFTPIKSRLSLHNSIKSFSYFIFGPKTIKLPNYEKYSYIQSSVNNINIVVVFGESVNYNFMSLFDFDQNTNPKLNEIKNDLVLKKSFSSSPITLVSASMFFNITREVDNPNNQIQGDVNLFKLAKENGFETSYFSAQEQNLAFKIKPEKIDNLLTKENIYFKLEKKADFYLIDLLKNHQNQLTDRNKKNFIVLHQRNAHSPYDYNYRNHPEFNVFQGNDRESTYKNAILMNDAFLFTVIDELKKMNLDKPTYVYFVSDHSESFGDDKGRYGHGFLSEQTVNVPFIYTCFNCERDKEIEDLFYPTHYEIAKLIAKRIGFEILNPNDNGDLYINGPSIYGNQGYWILRKDNEKKQYSIIKSN